MSQFQKPIFVNEQLHADKKTVSTYIDYRAWDMSLVKAEVVDNGNAFFHWHAGQHDKGHKSDHIDYTSEGMQRYRATIKDYVFFCQKQAKGGDPGETAPHAESSIVYLSTDSLPWRGSFAEQFNDR
ncbi:MAG: DUF4751 family protein [Zoogloeaceae bacterium]|jgi:hypothetical protein|nr:DUF4751 family protein [Zoogloeaceae bacterium]